MEKKDFRIGKINLILIAAGLLIIILGFLLMLGAPSGEVYNPDIFSVRRITTGPMISFFGFLFIIFAILVKFPSKNDK